MRTPFLPPLSSVHQVKFTNHAGEATTGTMRKQFKLQLTILYPLIALSNPCPNIWRKRYLDLRVAVAPKDYFGSEKAYLLLPQVMWGIPVTLPMKMYVLGTPGIPKSSLSFLTQAKPPS